MRCSDVLSLLCLIFLLVTTLIACGDKEPDDDVPDADSTPTMTETPQYDTAYDPNNEEAFEDMIFKQHAHLMARVSKDKVDSVMKATLLKAKDMRAGKAAAEKAMKDLMARQENLVRATIAKEFGISLDSIEAIMKEERAEIEIEN